MSQASRYTGLVCGGDRAEIPRLAIGARGGGRLEVASAVGSTMPPHSVGAGPRWPVALAASCGSSLSEQNRIARTTKDAYDSVRRGPNPPTREHAPPLDVRCGSTGFAGVEMSTRWGSEHPGSQRERRHYQAQPQGISAPTRGDSHHTLIGTAPRQNREQHDAASARNVVASATLPHYGVRCDLNKLKAFARNRYGEAIFQPSQDEPKYEI
ncbi:hypothetical protein B0H10DRAFT_2206701 [Mycena sp. CBHHK59/15]|nr:hypothetical protein B0H10DRAFT_2206701 [Mycena sp. CBHHK59/15]